MDIISIKLSIKSMPRMGNTIRMKNLALLALLFIIISAAQASLRTDDEESEESDTVFNVEKYGAVGGGTDDSTKAFAEAWDAACKSSSATLLVPESKTFLVNNIAFEGPCEPGFVFQVDGTIVAPSHRNSWETNKFWLLFEHLKQFTLSGNGTIDGRGNSWWENSCTTSNGKLEDCDDDDRPTAIRFNSGNGIVVEGLTSTNSPRFHLTFSNCDNVRISGYQITSPEDSPNTDGIDFSSTTNLLIQDTTIGTGDDCVGIGDGSSNITINGLTCGPGHGISIGSLGRDNEEASVHSVHIDGAKLIGTTNGLRIKTWPGGSGTATDILYENVEMENVKNPIIIDQFYCDSSNDCADKDSAVKISDVTYKNIHGTSATPEAIKIACSKSSGCAGIKFSAVHLTVSSGEEGSCVSQHAQIEGIGSCGDLT